MLLCQRAPRARRRLGWGMPRATTTPEFIVFFLSLTLPPSATRPDSSLNPIKSFSLPSDSYRARPIRHESPLLDDDCKTTVRCQSRRL